MKRNNSTISQEELIFSTLLYDRAKALGAALGSGSDFNSYVKRAFASYVEDGQPNPTEAWIDSYPPNSKQWVDRYMSDQFKYVSMPPEWLESNWVFLDGEPMTFVGQIPDENKISGDTPRWVYLFKGRKSLDGERFTEVYRYCIQEKDSDGYVYTSPDKDL